MNRLAEELARFCDTYRLDEKIFVAPSLAIGHQVAEAVVRAGHPWVNLRIETVHTLALRFIDTDLVQEGLKILSRAQGLALVEQACFKALQTEGYFGKVRDQVGFHQTVKATIEDMRGAAISPRSLRVELLDHGRKARELRVLADAYDRALAENHLVDDAEILRRALEKVKGTEQVARREGLYLLPDNLDLSPPEREFLQRFTGHRIYVLAVDDPSDWKPAASPVQIFRALGEENEVRGVFRRLLSDGIELDRIEILYTEAATYLPLIYELSAQYEMPCTYAEGVPVVFSRPGQAVLGYLDWLVGDYDARALRRIIGAEVVDLRKATGEREPPGAMRAARVLRDAGIGWGRERYISCLDALVRLYRDRQQGKGKDRGTHIDHEFHAKQMIAARAVRSFVQELLAVTPADSEGKIALRELAHGAAVFVEKFARIASELDGTAAMALRGLFEEFSSLSDTRIGFPQAIKRLRGAVGSTHVGAKTPEPGHLHISDYRMGGYSGREFTFILGLDESRYPGAGLQDPVLLDHERRRINRVITPQHLPLLGERPQENRKALRACLARLRGSVTMSYSCRNLLEDREQFPAPFLLELYRAIHRFPEADYTALLSATERPAGFIPSQGTYLDESEFWLERLKEKGRRSGAASAVVRTIYPWLDRGHYAEEERASERLTIFDGWVRDSDGELDPRLNRIPISSTEIEALARCPFSYFLRYILGIEPPDDYARDPTVWLDALEFGMLLHEIFRTFMVEITTRHEKPSFSRHWGRLKAIADECISRWRNRVPPPNTAAFATQRNHVLAACRTFLKDEEIHCQGVMPRYFEVPFGVSGVESIAPIASRDPVSIDLGEGDGFMLRGRIDRIDQRGEEEYEVWDYKSGSSRTLVEEKMLNRGRQIQHALYARAVEILLARAQLKGRVTRSGYFFPGPKGEGHRVVKEQDAGALERVISALFRLLREGIFPYAPDSDFCRFCDCQCVCEGPEKANERIHGKLESRTTRNTALEPFRRLVAFDD